MKCLFAITVATTVLYFPYGRAVAFQEEAALLPAGTTLNVNSRYKIESVEVENGGREVPKALRRELERFAGRAYRTELLDEIERRLKQEYPGSKVTRKVSKGDQANHVKLRFDLERSKRIVDFASPRLAYHSQQGFTFGADATARLGTNLVSFGLVTDNDEKVERFTGMRGAVVVPHGRFRFAFLAESYRAQWDREVRDAGVPLYRARNNFEPTLIFEVLPGLEFRAGFSFNQLEYQFPAAGDLASHAVISTLRYTKQRALGTAGTQTLEAGYNLRAAANFLSSDFSFRRHAGEVRYTMKQGESSLALSAMAGGIDGAAPILERFVLGNTRTLRGWNRFDLAPTGGNRMMHFSADGRYRFLRAIYDTGTVWDAGRPIQIRQSAGLGVVIHGFTAMVACPIRNGSIEPVFLLGMNF
jgi:hypothetical protein